MFESREWTRNFIICDEAKFDLWNEIILYVTTSKEGRFSLHTLHIFMLCDDAMMLLQHRTCVSEFENC